MDSKKSIAPLNNNRKRIDTPPIPPSSKKFCADRSYTSAAVLSVTTIGSEYVDRISAIKPFCTSSPSIGIASSESELSLPDMSDSDRMTVESRGPSDQSQSNFFQGSPHSFGVISDSNQLDFIPQPTQPNSTLHYRSAEEVSLSNDYQRNFSQVRQSRLSKTFDRNSDSDSDDQKSIDELQADFLATSEGRSAEDLNSKESPCPVRIIKPIPRHSDSIIVDGTKPPDSGSHLNNQLESMMKKLSFIAIKGDLNH